MYRCAGDFDDGLPVDFRSADLNIDGCLEEIRAKGLSYDVVLVDSFHQHEPSLRDLRAASTLIAEGGTLIVHDCNPPTEDVAGPDFMLTPWAGVSYKAYVDFLIERDDLDYFTVDTDWGCGVIRRLRPGQHQRGRSDRSEIVQRWRALGNDFHATFVFLQENKQALLNLVPQAHFLRTEAPYTKMKPTPMRGAAPEATPDLQPDAPRSQLDPDRPLTVAAPRPKSMFVLAVVGTRHVGLAATTLRFLKMFTRKDILVVQSRSAMRATHDQVLSVDLPAELDDHQASIALKTDLLRHVGGLADRFCYLDTDVIAVNEGIDAVFDQRIAPVAFAADHATIDAFSPWAVSCGCPQEEGCSHLRRALLRQFEIEIPDGGWQIWNGGVFVFDEGSEEFLTTWYRMARRVMALSGWCTRDQSTLAATAWKLGLQAQPLLPPGFNTVVDCMRNVTLDRRAKATLQDFEVDERYSLSAHRPPHFLHFINEGMWRRGWRNWDDVEDLLRRRSEDEPSLTASASLRHEQVRV
jgi:hypothetical protein